MIGEGQGVIVRATATAARNRATTAAGTFPSDPEKTAAGTMETDTQRGVWKASAGFDATVLGMPKLSVLLKGEYIPIRRTGLFLEESIATGNPTRRTRSTRAPSTSSWAVRH